MYLASFSIASSSLLTCCPFSKSYHFDLNHLAAFLVHNAYDASNNFEQRYYTTASKEVCEELQKEGRGNPVHMWNCFFFHKISLIYFLLSYFWTKCSNWVLCSALNPITIKKSWIFAVYFLFPTSHIIASAWNEKVGYYHYRNILGNLFSDKT